MAPPHSHETCERGQAHGSHLKSYLGIFRSQAAPSHLNTNIDPLSYHTPSRSTEIPSGGRKYTGIGL